MAAPSELTVKVEDYLQRRLSLKDLESWLAARLPLVLVSTDDQVAQLAAAVELFLAEVNAGIRTEGTAEACLQPLLLPDGGRG